jgi:hypothetical protein
MAKSPENLTRNDYLKEMASHGLGGVSGGSSTSIDHAKPEQWDSVNKPAHYNNGGIEAIDYISQQLGDHIKAYLEGNVLKYIHRHKYKNNPKQDLEKARWYLDRLIHEMD